MPSGSPCDSDSSILEQRCFAEVSARLQKGVSHAGFGSGPCCLCGSSLLQQCCSACCLEEGAVRLQNSRSCRVLNWQLLIEVMMLLRVVSRAVHHVPKLVWGLFRTCWAQHVVTSRSRRSVVAELCGPRRGVKAGRRGPQRTCPGRRSCGPHPLSILRITLQDRFQGGRCSGIFWQEAAFSVRQARCSHIGVQWLPCQQNP